MNTDIVSLFTSGISGFRGINSRFVVIFLIPAISSFIVALGFLKRKRLTRKVQVSLVLYYLFIVFFLSRSI